MFPIEYAINTGIRASVVPANTKQLVTTGIAIESPDVTEEQCIQNVKNIPEEWTQSLDYAWVDAGWYPLRNNWSDSVGNWYADPERFPDGLGEISEHLNERGMGIEYQATIGAIECTILLQAMGHLGSGWN